MRWKKYSAPFSVFKDFLFLYKSSVESLRDVDDVVTHVLELVHYIHIINAGLIVLAVILDFLDFSITKIVSETVDMLLCIVCIGNLDQCTLMSRCEVLNHCIISISHSICNALKLLHCIGIKSLVMNIPSAEDTADGLT